jgi:hypothetical protein
MPTISDLAMICFPDLTALLQALANEAVPSAVSRAPATAGKDDMGRVWLRPSVALPNSAKVALLRYGAELEAGAEPVLSDEITCWQQLVPPQRVPLADALAANVVLFEMNDLAQWARLAAEVERLKGKAATIAWSEPIDGDGLLLARVSGTPGHVLLRAMETPADQPGLRAYVAQASGVWVEAGWSHPLGRQLHAPPGRLILIRRQGTWRSLADGPFVGEVREFRVPVGPVLSPSDAPPIRPQVRLRLAAGVAGEAPELWVLRDEPLEQLASLVRTADDLLLSRLMVAMAEHGGRPLVVLRARAGKSAPPDLGLRAEGYRQHLKLPNLYIPCGARLHPPLRRDAVRQLLASDPDRVTWLSPMPGSQFQPEGLPAASFQALSDRVAYFSEHAPARLTSWFQTPRFELEGYQIREEAPEEAIRKLRPEKVELPAPRSDSPVSPTAPPTEEQQRTRGWLGRAAAALGRWFTPRRDADANNETAPEVPETPAANPAPGRPPRRSGNSDGVAEAVQMFLAPTAPPSAAPAPPPRPVSESAERQRALEQQFLALTSPADARERRVLWPELAGGYQGASNWVDAAACWLAALWEEETPTPLWLYGWFRSETRSAFWQEYANDLQRCLTHPRPNLPDIRAVAAFIVWAAADGPGHGVGPAAAPSSQREFLMRHLRRFREYLEAHEAELPVRSAWLAWHSLARLSGGDLLTLARARDRLLERLFQKGLSADQDLPSFLRFAGRGGSERFQTVRDWLQRLRQPIHVWVDRLEMHAKQGRRTVSPTLSPLVTEQYRDQQPPYGSEATPLYTRAYADLMLAWGLARLGAASEANQLVRKAREVLGSRDVVHRWLFAAFEYRAQQALENGTGDGPLPSSMLTALEAMEPLCRNKIDWLRQQSRILEPLEIIDPFRGEVQRDHFDALNPRLARLAEVRERDRLTAEARSLLAEAEAEPSVMPRILKATLELSPRMGEPFARELLERVTEVLDAMTDPTAEAALLERALFVAAHFELSAQVEALASRFEQLLDRQRGAGDARAFEAVAAQSFRGLRKLGLRDSIDRLLRQTADFLLPGVGAMGERLRGRSPAALRTLLHVAAGWFYEGADADATAVLDEVRQVIFEGDLGPKEQAALAGAYAAALGRAPGRLALDRIEELFHRLDRVHDRLNTNTHFSLAQLGVVEAVVQAVVHDDFALGAAVRRWLDSDEYLIRRRIHRDLRSLMG